MGNFITNSPSIFDFIVPEQLNRFSVAYRKNVGRNKGFFDEQDNISGSGILPEVKSVSTRSHKYLLFNDDQIYLQDVKLVGNWNSPVFMLIFG